MRLGYRARCDWMKWSWLGMNAHGRLGTRLWRRLGWRDGSEIWEELEGANEEIGA